MRDSIFILMMAAGAVWMFALAGIAAVHMLQDANRTLAAARAIKAVRR